MKKLYKNARDQKSFLFHCPGCKHGHVFYTDPDKKPCWTFNGDFEKPTFSPSLLNRQENPENRCHLFVEAGKIRFLNDCHHELAGQTVDMEDVYD